MKRYLVVDFCRLHVHNEFRSMTRQTILEIQQFLKNVISRLSKTMLKLIRFIAELVLVAIEASTKVSDLKTLPFQNSQTTFLSSLKLLHN